MRPFLLCSIVALMLLSSLVPLANRHAEADHAVELYRSEQFDYFFFYDATTWEMVEQESEPGSDYVRFSDGDIWASYWAFDASGLTPEECLGGILDNFNDDPSILAYEELVGLNDPISTVHGGVTAEIALIVTVDGADGAFKLATYEACEEVVPGQTLLYTSVNVPATSFNEGRRFDQPWIEGYLPAHAAFDGSAPIRIFDSFGNAVGTIKAYANCPGPPNQMYGTARNFGDSVILELDPNGFFVSPSSGDVDLARVEWLHPAMPNTSPSYCGLMQ